MGIHFDGNISLGNILAGASFLFALWRYHITSIREQNKNKLDLIERFNRLETSLIERVARLEAIVGFFETNRVNNNNHTRRSTDLSVD